MVHSLQQRNALEMGSSTHSLHTLTAPYHPSTNWEAERFVQTVKTLMQKHKRALQKNLCHLQLHYRSSYSSYHYWKALAEIMFGRNIKTRMDLLHPQSNERHSQLEESRVKHPLGKMLVHELEVGDAVWV